MGRVGLGIGRGWYWVRGGMGRVAIRDYLRLAYWGRDALKGKLEMGRHTPRAGSSKRRGDILLELEAQEIGKKEGREGDILLELEAQRDRQERRETGRKQRPLVIS